MKILIVVIILLAAGMICYCISASASEMSRMEERWLHPPSGTGRQEKKTKEADK